jgi:hypothetical protein
MASAKVVAVTGGVASNVGRNQINKLEGPLSMSLTVQNNAPARGGTERSATFVTEDDRKKLLESTNRSMTERLTQQVKRELAVSDKETVVPWTGQNPAVLESLFSKNAEEEAQSVSLTLKLRYSATVFANDAYNALMQDAATLQRLNPGQRIVPATLRAEPPSVVGVENGILRLTGRASATVSSAPDAGQMRAALAGKPVHVARSHLETLPGATGHELRVNGLLPGRMPFLAWRIGVTTNSPAA